MSNVNHALNRNEWPIRTLREVLADVGGFLQTGPFGSQLHAYDYTSEGVPVVMPQDILGGLVNTESIARVPEAKARQLARHRIEPNDIVFSRRGDLSRAAPISGREAGWLCGTGCFLLRAPSSNLDAWWLAATYRGSTVQRQVEARAVGSMMRSLNNSVMEQLEIPVPSLPEQRKIARILTTLDNLIEKTEALIAKYQAIKQGMMHDLFTRGVDSSGQLRPTHEQAPDLYKPSELGFIPKDWDSGIVEDVLVGRPKNGYSPKEGDAWTGTMMLGLGCLTRNGFSPIQLKVAPPNDAKLEQALLNDGDLLMSRSNTTDLVGLVGSYKDIGVPCIYSDLMMRLLPNHRVSGAFLEQLLMFDPVRRQLTNAACGTSGSMKKINSTMVLNTTIVWPQTCEQQEILHRLEPINGTIRSEQSHVNKLRQQKSGLMQDLLTGKVRVKVDEAEEVAAHG